MIEYQEQEIQTETNNIDQNLQTSLIEKSDQLNQANMIESQEQEIQTEINYIDQNLQTIFIETNDQECQAKLVNCEQNIQTDEVVYIESVSQTKSFLIEKTEQYNSKNYVNYDVQNITQNKNKN